MGQEGTRQSRGDEEAEGDAARECGERGGRAEGAVVGRRDARMGGEDAGRRIPGWPDSGASEIEVVGRGLVELEGTDAKRWSGMGSGSAGSKAGV